MSNVAPRECVTTTGVVAGGVVGIHIAEDSKLVAAAQEKLTLQLRSAFAAVDLTGNTPFQVWHERGPQLGPAGDYLGMGWKLCVAIPTDAHSRIREIVEGLPSFIDGIQVWAEPWDPGREQF